MKTGYLKVMELDLVRVNLFYSSKNELLFSPPPLFSPCRYHTSTSSLIFSPAPHIYTSFIVNSVSVLLPLSANWSAIRRRRIKLQDSAFWPFERSQLKGPNRRFSWSILDPVVWETQSAIFLTWPIGSLKSILRRERIQAWIYLL